MAVFGRMELMVSKRRGYSSEDVVKALDRAVKVLAEGGAVADACRKIGIN